MPAPPLSNNLDLGVDGVDVTSGDPGSPDSFNAVTGTPPKYTNVQARDTLSMRWVAQNNVQFCQFTGLGSITTNVYVRTYMYLPALPGDNNFYPLNFRTSADVSCAILRILADGTIQGRTADNSNAFAEGTISVATNQWVRLEWRVLPSTTAGTMEWRLYNNADSSTASDSASNAGIVLGANIDRHSIGLTTAGVAAGLTVYYDDIAVSSTGWIGPSAVVAEKQTSYYSRGRSWR